MASIAKYKNKNWELRFDGTKTFRYVFLQLCREAVSMAVFFLFRLIVQVQSRCFTYRIIFGINLGACAVIIMLARKSNV